jgi:hypothetical protein
MDNQFSHLLQLGKRDVERRYRELATEMTCLCTSFPDLSEAFDADELPVSFIIERGARGARVKGVRRYRTALNTTATPITRRSKKGEVRRRRAIDRP